MKYYIEVYGCTANKSDGCLAKGILKQKGYEQVDQIKSADFIVFLTCTVINTTEQRMLSRLKKLKKTGKKIIVGGCMPAVQADLIKKVIPDVILINPNKIQHIYDYIRDTNEITDRVRDKTFFPKKYDTVNAPIMVAEGCMFSCSYCITCKARGKLRSFSAEKIKEKVSEALSQDCKEIRITAQDTASYGLDIGKNLGFLLKEIGKIDGDYKIRVGMMNPFTFRKNLDEIIMGYQNSKVYRFVHLPFQSGSNRILKKMNRKYSAEEFLDSVKIFRKHFPSVTLSTDVIVGFPSETEEDFKKTVSLLKKVRPDITNITRFSARPLTKAKNMKGRVDTEVCKNRSRFLTDLCKDISRKNNEKFVGKKFDILLTEKGKNNTFVGRNKNYKPVVIKENGCRIGQTVNVEIVKAEDTYLVGNI